MKRLVSLALILAIGLGISLFGDRLAQRLLDERLAPLLEDNLGLPVAIGATKARLFLLQATTPRLVMGDPAAPAVVAGNVTVRIDLSALLEGEIRLASATAEDSSFLTVGARSITVALSATSKCFRYKTPSRCKPLALLD